MPDKSTAQTALHFGANDLDLRLTDGGELTHSYSVESAGEVKMTKQDSNPHAPTNNAYAPTIGNAASGRAV